MRKPEQTPEPSIEEILASIRRIIADDAPSASTAADAVEPRAQQPTPSADRRIRQGEPAARHAEDDVLELTEDFMLAEEGAAMSLQEPAEPGEVAGDPYAARSNENFYRDLYSEPAAPQQPGQTTAVTTPQDGVGDESSGGLFSAVMAEVQRFTGGSNSSSTGQQARAEPSASPDTWGQPDLEALTPSPRTSSRPVWSQRHAEGDGAARAEEAAPARAAPSDPRKPSFSNRDNWSQGVQMPVPDAGPATPFPTEEPVQARSAEAQEATPLVVEPAVDAASGQPTSEAWPSVGQAMEDAAAAMPSAAPRRPLSENVQSMAEELAERAVADFASDRLSAPPAADILKADKPFMDAITNTLADALSRGGDEADDFDDAPPPEDLIEESFGAGQPPVGFGPQSAAPAKPDRMTMPKIILDGGFVAPRSASAKDAEPTGADQETPELPREDIDDIVPVVQGERTQSPAYRPTGIAEPFMHNVPIAPGRAAAARPVSGIGAARETVATAERIQPIASSGPKTLEDTVREMLKPLLIQWLDENMPRIVNDAIREEIAANGLLPKAGGSRR